MNSAISSGLIRLVSVRGEAIGFEDEVQPRVCRDML